MKQFVAYYRVSTKKQGQSGLGLEAQKKTVTDFINGKGELDKEFTEIESGKKDKRIELEKALLYCKENQATLIIAKLDRLSRNITFIFSLKESSVDFICVDLPEMNTLTLGIFATLAQHERELISERTKKALHAKKEQGFKLGVKGKDNLNDSARQKSIESRKAIAKDKNQKAIAYIKSMRENGLGYKEIAKRLNNNGYRTSRGNAFFANSVRQLLVA